MDKHDRPYKCPAKGCEMSPSFTYPGGFFDINKKYTTFTVAQYNLSREPVSNVGSKR
jgi:hypothetical protein